MTFLSIDDANKYALKMGGKCLSKSYNANALRWQCKNKHKWSSNLSSMINNSSWCKMCVRISRRLSYDDIVSVAKGHGGKCLSSGALVSRSIANWECKNGHRWSARVNDVRQGTWCKVCSTESSKIGIKKLQKIARVRGGRCISKDYIKNSSKVSWECEFKHKWAASPSSVINNTWCPYCARYFSHDEVLKYINNVGGTLAEIPDGYISRNTIISYTCNCGCKISKKFRSIKEGYDCRECAYDKQRLTIDDMQVIAKNNNGKCLSSTYINTGTKLLWECEKLHQWHARPADIKSGGWCPHCPNKTQASLTKIIKKIFNNCRIYSNYRELDWLINPSTGRKLEIDIYIPKLKLAIEYDGEHHFMPVGFGNIDKKSSNSKLLYTKKMDKLKNKIINENKDKIKYFIRFTYKEKNKLTKEYVVKKFIKNKVPLVKND